MSLYLVDTDWIIDYLKGKEEKVNKLNKLARKGLAISVISLAEIYEGVYFSKTPSLHLKVLKDFLSGLTVLGIDEKVCQIFGKERGKLRKRGKILDNFDLLIAAVCLKNNLSLITDNVKHFKGIRGLKIFRK